MPSVGVHTSSEPVLNWSVLTCFNLPSNPGCVQRQLRNMQESELHAKKRRLLWRTQRSRGIEHGRLSRCLSNLLGPCTRRRLLLLRCFCCVVWKYPSLSTAKNIAAATRASKSMDQKACTSSKRICLSLYRDCTGSPVAIKCFLPCSSNSCILCRHLAITSQQLLAT